MRRTIHRFTKVTDTCRVGTVQEIQQFDELYTNIKVQYVKFQN